ncbi:MAG: DUF262 domain-containing protein [Gammaproteobacteria bacterium]|nr:DUF262 domain-containing protein [Rhodothermaceae bacterium]MYE14529.1 DUF262 domain-containing protein [Gammaproteobacteria bacterium]
MEKTFKINDVPLADLLQQAAQGELQLPDFQRGWVWDDRHIVSLLASISLSFPIGAVMTLATGNPRVKFRPRLLEGVKLVTPKEPGLLLLDGQQRLTSLYFALRSPDPVITRDTRGRTVGRHYYADINRCIGPDPYSNREDEGLVSIPESRLVTTDFGRKVTLDLRTREDEIAGEMFPLDIVFDPDKTMDWQLEYLSSTAGDQNRIEKWKAFYKTIVTPFLRYQVPTIELSKDTSKEAVCQVFEKVNTGGVSLTVFELLTATYAADDFDLREDWQKREARFGNYPVLANVEAPQFLQAVTLLTTYDRRMSHLNEPVPPAVACKRRDILQLQVEDYRKWADPVADGLCRAVEFLHGEYIFAARDVPYPTQLVPLGAIFAVLGNQAHNYAALQKIRQWFWCGVFGEMYGGSTETRFAFDLPECVDWVLGEGAQPRTVTEAQFQAERLLTLRTRISAAYKGLYALQMKRGSRDFKSGVKLESNVYFDNSIDIHHVFPRSWCVKNDVERRVADSVVNKTPIDSHTNRLIGGSAPSKYLERLEEQYSIETQDLDSILLSHDINPSALRSDDFPSYFNERFERMVKLIEHATGKAANRSRDRDESPFASKEALEDRLGSLIAAGERDTLEFKSTGRKNLYTGNRDPAIEWSVVKAIAAFRNTDGGELVIGIDDMGQPVGIEEDYPFVKSHNRDGWELWLNNLISMTLGKIEATAITPRYCEVDGTTVAYIKFSPGSAPVFATPTKSATPAKGSRSAGEDKFFYVRTGNATQQLVGSDLLDYTKKHWPN